MANRILSSICAALVPVFAGTAHADNFLVTTSAQFSLSGVSTDAVTDCIPVIPGAFYEFGAEVLINVQGGAMGRAGVVIRGMTNGECTAEKDPNFPNFTLAGESAATDWYPLLGGFLAKDGVVAGLVELRGTQTSSAGSMTAHIRNAFLRTPDRPNEPDCADPAMPYDQITASDALQILRGSVGTVTCVACQCDANLSGATTASDALATLKHAVGQQVAIGCPTC